MALVRVRHRTDPTVLARVRVGNGTRNDMLRRAIRVQTAARDRLGHNPKRIDTGRLRASISFALDERPRGWVAVIYTNVEYAIYVHEGTRYMRANPFLRDALKAAGR